MLDPVNLHIEYEVKSRMTFRINEMSNGLMCFSLITSFIEHAVRNWNKEKRFAKMIAFIRFVFKACGAAAPNLGVSVSVESSSYLFIETISMQESLSVSARYFVRFVGNETWSHFEVAEVP